MRKSNGIIMAVLAVGCGVFLWLWYYLGFNFVDDPLDLVIAVVWWALVLALAFGIHFAEKKRRRRVRTVYVSDCALFNSEAGLVAFQGEKPTQDSIAAVLYNLKYDFSHADEPDLGTFDARYLVRTDKFDAEKREDETQAETQAESPAVDPDAAPADAAATAEPAALGDAAPAAPVTAAATVPLTAAAAQPDAGEGPLVEPREWKGEVVVVKTKEEHPFETPEELAAILDRLQQAAA